MHRIHVSLGWITPGILLRPDPIYTLDWTIQIPSHIEEFLSGGLIISTHGTRLRGRRNLMSQSGFLTKGLCCSFQCEFPPLARCIYYFHVFSGIVEFDSLSPNLREGQPNSPMSGPCNPCLAIWAAAASLVKLLEITSHFQEVSHLGRIYQRSIGTTSKRMPSWVTSNLFHPGMPLVGQKPEAVVRPSQAPPLRASLPALNQSHYDVPPIRPKQETVHESAPPVLQDRPPEQRLVYS